MKKILIMLSCVAGLAMTVSALEYAVSYTEYELACAQIAKGKTPLPEGTVYPVQGNLKKIPSKYLIIDNGVLREKTTEEKAVYDAAKIAADDAKQTARQLAKTLELKTAENNFLDLCDALTGESDHAKLGFPALEVLINAIAQWDTRTDMTVKLLVLNTQAQRYFGADPNAVGNFWWDDCIWHPEIAE